MQELVDPDLVLFARVVEQGSLAAAARLLGISAPMASRRLSRLEARLGVRLVHRTTRRLGLTPQGAAFHQDVLALLRAAEQAAARLKDDARGPAGALRISAPTSFGRLHLAPTLKAFIAHHPRVDLTLHLSDSFVDLVAERYDLAIRITAEVGGGLAGERLATSRRVLCAAPHYLARRGEPAGIEALHDHDLLAADGQLPWRLNLEGREAVVAGRSVVKTNSSEVVRELALAGAGVALRSLWDVSDDLAAGRLRRVLPQAEGSLEVGIYAVRPRAPFVPAAVEAFVAHLRALLQPYPPWEVAS